MTLRWNQAVPCKENRQVERIYTFLPSVLVLICIAGATVLYLIWITNRFGGNLKSVNRWIVIWTVDVPLINVVVPAAEELVFRAPLIIAFSAVSSVAWYGIFASSALFALLHWDVNKIWPEFLPSRKNDARKDDVVTEVNRLHQEKDKMIIMRKVCKVVCALTLGILAGYYGIKYQSIWMAFGIHSVWNLIVTIFLVSISYLSDRAKRNRECRNSSSRNNQQASETRSI